MEHNRPLSVNARLGLIGTGWFEAARKLLSLDGGDDDDNDDDVLTRIRQKKSINQVRDAQGVTINLRAPWSKRPGRVVDCFV